jgi:hypothetical protein
MPHAPVGAAVNAAIHTYNTYDILADSGKKKRKRKSKKDRRKVGSHTEVTPLCHTPMHDVASDITDIGHAERKGESVGRGDHILAVAEVSETIAEARKPVAEVIKPFAEASELLAEVRKSRAETEIEGQKEEKQSLGWIYLLGAY